MGTPEFRGKKKLEVYSHGFQKRVIKEPDLGRHQSAVKKKKKSTNVCIHGDGN